MGNFKQWLTAYRHQPTSRKDQLLYGGRESTSHDPGLLGRCSNPNQSLSHKFGAFCLIAILSVFGGASAFAGDDKEKDKNQCMEIEKPELMKCDAKKGCVLRDQFSAEQLLALSKKLVHDFNTGNSQCKITLPVWSWTGDDPINTRVNLPTETLVSSNMSANQIAEHLLSLAGLMVYQLEPEMRAGALSTDILNLGKPFDNGRAKYTQGMQDLIASMLAKKAAGTITLDEIHDVALSLGVSYLKQLTTLYADPNEAFENNGNQLYSTTTHKFYNQLQGIDMAGYGFLNESNWMGNNFSFLNYLPQDIFGFTEENIKAMPQAFALDAQKLAAMLSYEKYAVGKYFWPRLFVDPRNSQLYTFTGVDPDGYRRPDGVELVNFDHAGITMTWDWLSQMASPLASIRLDAPNGAVPCAISLNGCPADGVFGLADLINLNASAPVATQVIQDITKLWNEKIAPIYGEFGRLAAIRRAESQDDFYPGVWRAKMRTVQKVTHDADGKAISAKVITADGKSLTVPLDGSTSSNKDVKKAIADIAEMDKWFNDNLAVAQNLSTGDVFNLLGRTDATKGICGASEGTGTVPYNSVEEILDNYSSTPKVVNVDLSLADLVYKNGFQVSRLFYDIREYLANVYVKENYSHYNFANATSAGLCKTNLANQTVNYNQVYEDIYSQNTNTFETSDISVLGRHYGYDVNGNIKADEWSNGKLIYTYLPFDYVYRQHYAVDNTQPLKADNFSDPKSSGRKFYQYTDVGDEAKRSAFTSAFFALETTTRAQADANKPGTYLRWKIDWTLQKLAAYVIASIAGNTPNVAAQNLLPHDFQQQYYASTFEDTNDHNTDFCGFGLQHTAPETVHFRAVGQLAGSANSGTTLDIAAKKVTIKIAFPTGDPINVQTTQSLKSTLLHEGALGHGFDNIPKNIDRLRGNSSTLSWLTNFNQNGGIPTEGFWYTYYTSGPGIGNLFEGWATYGELNGVRKNLESKIDAKGCPIANTLDTVAAFNGIVDLARIGARQVISVAENYSHYGWSFYHSTSEFTRLSGLKPALVADFLMRFIGHPTQQTEYASGFVSNISILGNIKARAIAQGCHVNEAEFNKFRITRTDYILGANLQKVVDDNYNSLIICP